MDKINCFVENHPGDRFGIGSSPRERYSENESEAHQQKGGGAFDRNIRH